MTHRFTDYELNFTGSDVFWRKGKKKWTRKGVVYFIYFVVRYNVILWLERQV